MSRQTNEPVGDSPSALTILTLVLCVIFLLLVVLLPVSTLQTDAVYGGF